MDHGLEIIPISSHRRAATIGARPQSTAAARQKRRGWGLPLAAAGGLLFIAIAALSRAEGAGSIQSLPPQERSTLYERTLADTESSCALPDSRTGALHDHCLRQAEFLVLFPECDGGCRQLTGAILPHATR
jgi:hypothetical protein